MKYAFSNGDMGIINIILIKKDAKILLTIDDNGRGLPENINVETTDTFGMTLVTMLAKQLRGTFSISSDNGTRCLLEFKL